MLPFSSPTIEEVTLLASNRLGHECEDLLSLSDGMHVCTD